jgi:hypothetical protein
MMYSAAERCHAFSQEHTTMFISRAMRSLTLDQLNHDLINATDNLTKVHPSSFFHDAWTKKIEVLNHLISEKEAAMTDTTPVQPTDDQIEVMEKVFPIHPELAAVADALPDDFFRTLDDEETDAFEQWARENYTAGDDVNPFWHPAVRNECKRINAEAEYVASEQQWADAKGDVVLQTPQQIAISTLSDEKIARLRVIAHGEMGDWWDTLTVDLIDERDRRRAMRDQIEQEVYIADHTCKIVKVTGGYKIVYPEASTMPGIGRATYKTMDAIKKAIEQTDWLVDEGAPIVKWEEAEAAAPVAQTIPAYLQLDVERFGLFDQTKLDRVGRTATIYDEAQWFTSPRECERALAAKRGYEAYQLYHCKAGSTRPRKITLDQLELAADS